MDIFRIICEEFQRFNEELEDYEWYDDQGDQSLADKMYANRFGINPEKTQQGYQEDNTDTKGELAGLVTDRAYVKLKTPVPLYLNPKSLIGFDPYCRAVLMHSGDLYVIPVGSTSRSGNNKEEPFHYNILQVLVNDGLVQYNTIDNYAETYPREYICVVREGRSNTFSQGDMYDEFPDYYNEMMSRANTTQPFNFKVKQHA